MKSKQSREKSIYWKTFGPNVRAILQLRGLSQRALAKGVGESEGTVSRWLTGAANPNSEKLFKIADFLDVSVDQLIGRLPRGAKKLTDLHEQARALTDALGRVLPLRVDILTSTLPPAPDEKAGARQAIKKRSRRKR